MAVFRLRQILPAILWAVAAQAQPLPAAQNPAAQERPVPGLGDHAVSGGYGNPFLWTCLADLAHGRIVQGEVACGRAIALDPKDADAYELRGYAYLLEHRFEQAETDFLTALKLRPNSAAILAGYGQSLSGLGRFDGAVTQFTRAVALAPSNAAYRNGLCWARAGSGKNLKRALDDCRVALALAPGAPGPLNSQGLVELRLGRFDAAIADYTASLAAKAQQPSARFGRGLAHLGLGQIAAGGADILSARKADPEIDDLFVLLGVLPRDCGQARPKCPPGFPPAAPLPAYRGVSVAMTGPLEENDLLAIEARRLEIMVGRMSLMLAVQLGQDVKGGGPTAPDDVLTRLSRMAAQFNAMLPLACQTGRVPRMACGPWRPAWNAAWPGLAVGESYEHIMPVWTALCRNQEKLCQIG